MARPKKNKAEKKTKISLCIAVIMASITIAVVVSKLIIAKKSATYQKTVSQQLQLQLPKNIPAKLKRSVATDNTDSHELWTTITTKSGDNLSKVFQSLGLDNKQLVMLSRNRDLKQQLDKLKPGKTLQFLINKGSLVQMVYPIADNKVLLFSRTNNTFSTKIKNINRQARTHFVTATIEQNLFTAGKRHHLSNSLLNQLTQIFSETIDFSKDIRKGAQFTLVYEKYYIDEKAVSTGKILAASVTNRGHTAHAIRYTYPDGHSDYFSPKGHSLTKAFNRYPVNFSHISSSFSRNRPHPVLHEVSRAHKGIDLAASQGTPIHAVSDGTIQTIASTHGYGNMIKIKHNRKYQTLYAHMHHFKDGIYRGLRVKKDQVIGYVGQTGLATGPHCHFEFHIHQKAVNPASVKLPNAAPIAAAHLAQFLAMSRPLLAQLQLYEAAKLAAN